MASGTAVITLPPKANVPPDGGRDFLERFAVQELQRKNPKRLAPLSAEEHAAHREQLKGVRFIKPKYSDNSEINITGINGKWKR